MSKKGNEFFEYVTTSATTISRYLPFNIYDVEINLSDGIELAISKGNKTTYAR